MKKFVSLFHWFNLSSLWQLYLLKWMNEMKRERGPSNPISRDRSPITASLPVWTHCNADARRILTASPPNDWRKPPARPHVTWFKTMQQDRKSKNLCLNEAIDMAQNRPLCQDCLRLALRTPSGACHKTRWFRLEVYLCIFLTWEIIFAFSSVFMQLLWKLWCIFFTGLMPLLSSMNYEVHG